MPQFNLINENGNASAKVRDAIREVAVKNALSHLGETAMLTNKGIVVPVGTDTATGQTIYLTLAVAISLSAEKPEKEVEAVADEPIVIPDLF